MATKSGAVDLIKNKVWLHPLAILSLLKLHWMITAPDSPNTIWPLSPSNLRQLSETPIDITYRTLLNSTPNRFQWNFNNIRILWTKPLHHCNKNGFKRWKNRVIHSIHIACKLSTIKTTTINTYRIPLTIFPFRKFSVELLFVVTLNKLRKDCSYSLPQEWLEDSQQTTQATTGNHYISRSILYPMQKPSNL